MTTRSTVVTDGTTHGHRVGTRLLKAPGRAWLWSRGLLGRHLSVRWKLTLWYALIYAITLAAIAYALPIVLQNQTNRVIDQRLRETAGRMTVLLSQNRVVSPAVPVPECAGERPVVMSYCDMIKRKLKDNYRNLTAPGQFEQVVVNAPRADRPFNPHFLGGGFGAYIGPEIVGYVAATGKSKFLDIRESGADIRAYLLPLQVPPNLQKQYVVGVLEVFQAKTSYVQIRDALFAILLFAIPIGTLAALLIGWIIARAALRPIGRISRTVQAIGRSRDMSRRLDFVGPQDEIGRLAETFDVMMDRLEQVFETQKRFVADASHELRTPLTAIRGNADLMRIAPPEEREAILGAIRRESERMSRLVNDLLLLAEADIAEQPIHKRTVDLDDLLSEVCRSAQVVAGDKVTVALEQADPIVMQADPDRIKQLLLNLTDNAVKFTPKGGSVTLSAHRQDDCAVIEVSDTGVGIAKDEQEAIFRRFYRVDAARTTRGSGLGLAISAWIVHAHGGSIDVRSHPGKGSTFTVMLPLREGVASSQRADYSQIPGA